MRFKENVAVIMQGIVLGLLTAVVVIVAKESFSADGVAKQMYRSFVFENSLRAINSFQVRNYDYRGACDDTALPEYIRCVENGEAFKLEVERLKGGFYCADNAGFEGVTFISTGDALTCK